VSFDGLINRGLVREFPPTARTLKLKCHCCGQIFAVTAGGRRHGGQHARKYCDSERCRRIVNQVRANNRRCRALGIVGEITPREWWEVCSLYDWRCRGCRQQADILQIDHIIPLNRGGDNTRFNVRPLCNDCHKNLPRNDLGLFTGGRP
jgi:5-methylcytosine-specific restriction endonuclease McrA